ncbi:MAG TPA: hypothetical protein VGN88_06135 [Phycisphaerae bacterium]|jgi:hypothetical protein
MISVTLIVTACIIIALGRAQIRRARRGTAGIVRRLCVWTVLALGLILMILGVMAW